MIILVLELNIKKTIRTIDKYINLKKIIYIILFTYKKIINNKSNKYELNDEIYLFVCYNNNNNYYYYY